MKFKKGDYLIMKCPNLRWVEDKKGFFGGKGHWECSCIREVIDYNYVNNVCNCNAVTGAGSKGKNFWSLNQAETNALNSRYKDCNHYRRYGIRN